ncbi:hypothetical protein [Leptolyngbya sp. FACHB-261]|uniref:hypothetical protein n=1 Tax=Leptolyngbya sp. FACHB-261 TaxID=2692806 RepID=UPI0016829FAC|nr:hypothetical protein [Leptolyngbya sp. FACHB-261]MBD2103143.1 hypothetical protein [Leptolyngbya sp. FACHB-261]
MQQLLLTFEQIFRQKVLMIALISLIQLSGLFLFLQPGYAAETPGQSLSAGEKVERAYDGYSQNSGVREETYLQKVDAGQDPEKLPEPYKRITSLDGKEVPKTSALESTVSKVRNLVDRVTEE